jgi:chromosome segregation protein
MYIKQIELSRFKSFGGTTPVPLLPGFTVISGPNGSGKSNILDALLFALGLSSSKGMRADRLPDLVNQGHAKKGRTVETSVTVTFALDGENEWQVTRKLRVTSQGTYTSTYYNDRVPCTLTELHEQLAKLHIYPEGYNVVLQGDVTSIISMNARDRREIIDELAGVGEFDRKINQAKDKLEDVRTQEERFRIVETELQQTQEKLKGDRLKAEKYQLLRIELEQLLAGEVVLQQRECLAQIAKTNTELEKCTQTEKELIEQISTLTEAIAESNQKLESLNQQVQKLGEEEYLALSTNIASQNAELRAQQRQKQELDSAFQTNQTNIAKLQAEINDYQLQQQNLQQKHQEQTIELEIKSKLRDAQKSLVESQQFQIKAIADSSSEWVEQQSKFYQELSSLQTALSAQQQEQARLQEAFSGRSQQQQSQGLELTEISESLPGLITNLEKNEILLQEAQSQIQSAATMLTEAQTEIQVCYQTRDRLLQEQKLKSRQLDKLEAEAQVSQEAQSSRTMQVISAHNLSGVFGLVAQLGKVEPRFQLALEISAGSRLANIVVESDETASKAIQILKQERAGRATFLPLNRLHSHRYLPKIDQENGAIEYALNLIAFEPRFLNVFAHVFGHTLVFENLSQARSQIGKFRMVTLDGELLETTGAITGGSNPQRSGMHFGRMEATESIEAKQLQERLSEIDRMLQKLEYRVRAAQSTLQRYEEQMQQGRNSHREAQLNSDRDRNQITQFSQRQIQIESKTQLLHGEIALIEAQLNSTMLAIADLEPQVISAREQLAAWEKSGTHTQWQQAQAELQIQEQKLSLAELEARSQQQQILDSVNQTQLLQDKTHQRHIRLQEIRNSQTDNLNQANAIANQIEQQQQQIAQQQIRLTQLEQILQTTKQDRDSCDRHLRNQQNQAQQAEWQKEKNHTRQQELNSQLATFNLQLSQIELPDPLPTIPLNITLEQLQHDQRRLQKRLQSMEPVNMMAIAEFEATTSRLNDLTHRLETLSQERTEILLRIEDFTTLRQRAFMQAFEAVDQNFQEIFAELSDGDGHLQLENPTAPLSGGLNLVAHPKGKPVQHLSSMSGGEKSLTALSFIFALQRFRPSPFYAFDEVDMFLDGANVERLSRMVRKQADLAQFIVVSLRRPMIEAAERTIGVTQARGAHTQVLGLELNLG